MSNITKIYIVCHKKSDLPQLDNYYPIQVGAFDKEKIYDIGDNSGDNISHKNKNFCELTALYWIWKNDLQSDYIGMVHYRRFFFKKSFNNNYNNIINSSEITNLLENYDCILPKKTKFIISNVKKHYYKSHVAKDYENCRLIIEKIYPEYLESFDKISNSKKLHSFNMFIMKKHDFNRYMDWLFNILFNLEKITDINLYDDYNKRIYGFLSERLLNVWIYYNKLNIKELPVYRTDISIIEQKKNKYIGTLKNFIKTSLHRIFKIFKGVK